MCPRGEQNRHSTANGQPIHSIPQPIISGSLQVHRSNERRWAIERTSLVDLCLELFHVKAILRVAQRTTAVQPPNKKKVWRILVNSHAGRANSQVGKFTSPIFLMISCAKKQQNRLVPEANPTLPTTSGLAAQLKAPKSSLAFGAMVKRPTNWVPQVPTVLLLSSCDQPLSSCESFCPSLCYSEL